MILPNYPGDQSATDMINGIDVSVYQGDIDWKQVKASGKEFAFVRLGWAGWDGKIAANGGVDKRFAANLEGAVAAGLKAGVYVYSYCKTAEAAKVAAAEALALVSGYTLEYPVVFDMEDTSDSGVRYDQMTPAANTAIAKAFLQEVQAAKYYAMLYSYKSFAENYLVMADLTAYDFWLAQYAATATYGGSYGIWQYTGSGTCPGISTACDLNYAYRDYAAVIRAAGLNGLSGAGDTGNGGDSDRVRQLEQALSDIRSTIDGVL